MLLIIICKNNECHIVSHQNRSGYFTLCGKKIDKNNNDITIAADNTFSRICLTCKKYEDKIYSHNLNKNLVNIRSINQFHMINTIRYIEPTLKFYKIKFSRILNKREESKIVKSYRNFLRYRNESKT